MTLVLIALAVYSAAWLLIAVTTPRGKAAAFGTARDFGATVSTPEIATTRKAA